jgi:hypothetical protein
MSNLSKATSLIALIACSAAWSQESQVFPEGFPVYFQQEPPLQTQPALPARPSSSARANEGEPNYLTVVQSPTTNVPVPDVAVQSTSPLSINENTAAINSFGSEIPNPYQALTEPLQFDNSIEYPVRPASDYAAPVGVEFAPALPRVEQSDAPKTFGEFLPGGRGFQVAKTPYGELMLSAWTYLRYLNQGGIDDSYTDSFGRSFDINKRNDIQLNKLMTYMKGWVYDPRLNYAVYSWTANTSQGDPAQVVLAGTISWVLTEKMSIGAGTNSLPGTRNLRNTFPYWVMVDHRPLAEEFFRPSFTTGYWIAGKLFDRVQYRVMQGNNNSQLGVTANRLPAGMNTFSGSIWWMPTTGEYGPANGFGDFQEHDMVATQFGLSYTNSRETRQSQPGAEDLYNSQIRLADGTNVLSPNAFNTGGGITRLHYNMLAVDAGVKYMGYSLESEYYFRWLDDFRTTGFVPVDSMFDHGFQLLGSTMVLPSTLQAYCIGSRVFGEYGDPWSVSTGMNWFPTGAQLFRVNMQVDVLNKSPVGYSAFPYPLGANGTVFHTNVELFF